MKKVMMIVQVLGWLVAVIGGPMDELKELLGDAEDAINERLHQLAKPAGRKTLKKMAALDRRTGADDVGSRTRRLVGQVSGHDDLDVRVRLVHQREHHWQELSVPGRGSGAEAGGDALHQAEAPRARPVGHDHAGSQGFH